MAENKKYLTLTLEEILKLAEKAQWVIQDEHTAYYGKRKFKTVYGEIQTKKGDDVSILNISIEKEIRPDEYFIKAKYENELIGQEIVPSEKNDVIKTIYDKAVKEIKELGVKNITKGLEYSRELLK